MNTSNQSSKESKQPIWMEVFLRPLTEQG